MVVLEKMFSQKVAAVIIVAFYVTALGICRIAAVKEQDGNALFPQPPVQIQIRIGQGGFAAFHEETADGEAEKLR